MQIRLASPADAPILTSIHKDCFPNYWNHEAFTDFFAVAGTLVLLVEEAGEPAGMGVFRVQHEQADIITIAVRPAWRRRGIARWMLERAMSDSRQLGGTSMFLDVEEGNQAALSLYSLYCFVQIGRRRHYYRQKDGSFTDALVMNRKLI